MLLDGINVRVGKNKTLSTILHLSMLSGMSFTNNTNNNGHSMNPCGTSRSTLSLSVLTIRRNTIHCLAFISHRNNT